MLKITHKILKGSELKKKIYTGSFWISIGFGSQKVLQLLSNLILTRILYPEAFGLMALVNVFIVAVTMLSDVGIKPAIIQSHSANNLTFLNTAWTLQIFRGIVLWAVLCLIAYPASQFYGEDALFALLCFTGVNSFIAGFKSIDVILAERNVQLKKLMMIKLMAQVGSLLLMIGLALAYKSVWSLAIGTVFGALIDLTLGHILIKGHQHKLCWDPSCAKQIFRFGQWIFWSTIFTFFSGQGVRMIEAGFVSTETLAMIALAATIAWMLGDFIERFTGGVVFPSLSKIHREEPHRFSSILSKLRSRVLILTIPVFCALSLISVFIIDILYDDRYKLAGPILAILAINGAIRTMPQIYQNALLAQGNSRLHFVIVAVLAILNICGLSAGYYFFGLFGMLIGSGLGYLAGYVITVVVLSRSGWVSLKLDLICLIAIAIFAFISFSLHLDIPA